MDTDGPDPTDTESDLLMGILDILDPELFLKSCEQQEECEESQMLLVGGGHAVPAAAPAALGTPPVKLEALNELIHFDHIYTKPVDQPQAPGEEDDEEVVKIEVEEEMKIEEEGFHEVEVESVYVKEESEEVGIIPDEPLPHHHVTTTTTTTTSSVDDFFSPSPALCETGGFEKTASLALADGYSDSGYERSPSPFSDMSSPLCHEGAWDDVFANELFPQLISV